MIASLFPGTASGQTNQYADFRTQHVVLRTGSVFSGVVERTNDWVTVRSQNGIAVKLTRSEVDFITDSIDYAADRLANRIVDDNPESHRDMANWCLRFGALSGAQREIEWLSSTDFSRSELRELQRRLEIVRNPATPAVSNQVSADNQGSESEPPRKIVHSEHFLVREQLQTALDSISKNARRDFTSQVHIRIINGCAAAQCHGNPTIGMRLWRDDRSTGLESTSTQRNLLAILKQVDRQTPDNSQLLTYMTTAHGGQAEPAFLRDSPEWNEIRNWVTSIVIADEMVADASTSIAPASLQTPVNSVVASLANGVEPPEPVDLLSNSGKTELSTDPYDPELFNRTFSSPNPATPFRSSAPTSTKFVTVPERHTPLPGVESVKETLVAPTIRKTRPLPPVEDDNQ